MARGAKQTRVYISADTKGLDRGLDKGSRKLKQFGNDGQRMGKTFGGVSKKLLGVAAGIGSIAGATHTIKDAVQSTEALAKGTAGLARLTGQSTREASRWVEVAKVRGVESKALNMGFISLAKNMQAATDGGEAQQKMFKDLGVSQKVLESGKSGAVLAELADAFEAMPPGAQKAATAQKLFGRQAQTLLPLLDGGSKALREQLALSDKYGTSLSKNQVKQALEAVAAQRELNMAMDGVKIAIATKVMPWFVKGGRAAADLFAEVRQGKGVFGTFARGVSALVKGIVGGFDRLPDVFKKVLAGAGLLGAAFLAGGPVGLAVAAVAAGAGLIVANWDKIKPVFDRVRAAVGGAAAQIRPYVKGLIDAVVGAVPALQNVGRVVQWLFEKVWLPVAKRALPGVVQVVQGAIRTIAGVLNVFSGILTGDWSKAWKGVKQIVTGALKVVGGLIRAATAPFRAAMEIVWKGVKAAASTAWAGIKALVTAAVRSVVERVKNAAGNARDAAGKVVKALSVGFRAVKSAVINPVKNALTAAVTWIGDRERTFLSAGKGLVDAIVRGIRQSPHAIVDAIKGLIPGPVKTVLEKAGGLAGGLGDALGFREGGIARYAAMAGLIPAMLSPGEVGVQPDGTTFRVPGPRVAADTVPALLRPDTAILTDDGQARMSMGATITEAIRDQAPHFGKGGIAKSAINTATIAARTAGFRGRRLVNMVAISGRETGGTWDPRKTNFVYPDHSIGLWQINQLAHKGRFGTDRQLMNPLVNARAAKHLFDENGYGPWVGVNYGNAASYLGVARQAVLATKGQGLKGTSYTKTTQPKVSHPLLANMLAPLVDDALTGGIDAGIQGTSRRHLLTDVLEGIRPESGDRPTRRKVTVNGLKGAAGGGAFRPGGGWAGTKNLVLQAIRGYQGSVSSYKRNVAINGNQNSDHNSWIKNAYAADIAPGSDSIFARIAHRLRIPARKGSWNIFNNKPLSGFRSQLLWHAPDGTHRDHVHLGIRKLRLGGLVAHSSATAKAKANRTHRRRDARKRNSPYHKFVVWMENDQGVPIERGLGIGAFSGYLHQYYGHYADREQEDRWWKKWNREDRYRRGGMVRMRNGGVPRDRLQRIIRQLGGRPGTAAADRLTRMLSRRVRGANIGQLVHGERTIEKRIRKMSRHGFTGSERIKTRRLRGALSLLQDEEGRPIGRDLGATDRVQERIGRREGRIDDELIVAGIDPESDEGIARKIALDQQSLGSLGTRRTKLGKALKRAKKTGNRAAIRQVQGEINEVDDQMLTLESSIIQLNKSVTSNTESNVRLAELAQQQIEEQQRTRAVIEAQGPQTLAAIMEMFSGGIGGRIGAGFASPSFPGGVARY